MSLFCRIFGHASTVEYVDHPEHALKVLDRAPYCPRCGVRLPPTKLELLRKAKENAGTGA